MSSLMVHCDDPAQRRAGLAAARDALGIGELVVVPTDTVYGIAADAFSPSAVTRLLAAKGRGRHMPPPVLVGDRTDVSRLVGSLPEGAKRLMDEFWPGGVTIVLEAKPGLEWDLGETSGTVAVRMPDHPVARELLAMTGPLAVSSANRSGEPPATTAQDALAQLGDSVAVYLNAGGVGGTSPGEPGNPGSTIVDATAGDSGLPWRVIRHGVVPAAELRRVVGGEWAL